MAAASAAAPVAHGAAALQARYMMAAATSSVDDDDDYVFTQAPLKSVPPPIGASAQSLLPTTTGAAAAATALRKGELLPPVSVERARATRQAAFFNAMESSVVTGPAAAAAAAAAKPEPDVEQPPTLSPDPPARRPNRFSDSDNVDDLVLTNAWNVVNANEAALRAQGARGIPAARHQAFLNFAAGTMESSSTVSSIIDTGSIAGAIAAAAAIGARGSPNTTHGTLESSTEMPAAWNHGDERLLHKEGAQAQASRQAAFLLQAAVMGSESFTSTQGENGLIMSPVSNPGVSPTRAAPHHRTTAAADITKTTISTDSVVTSDVSASDAQRQLAGFSLGSPSTGDFSSLLSPGSHGRHRHDRNNGPPTKTFAVVAVESYSGRDQAELSFVNGQVIQVESTQPTGWWFGRCDHRRGWFPCTFVAPINASDLDGTGVILVGTTQGQPPADAPVTVISAAEPPANVLTEPSPPSTQESTPGQSEVAPLGEGASQQATADTSSQQCMTQDSSSISVAAGVARTRIEQAAVAEAIAELVNGEASVDTSDNTDNSLEEKLPELAVFSRSGRAFAKTLRIDPAFAAGAASGPNSVGAGLSSMGCAPDSGPRSALRSIGTMGCEPDNEPRWSWSENEESKAPVEPGESMPNSPARLLNIHRTSSAATESTFSLMSDADMPAPMHAGAAGSSRVALPPLDEHRAGSQSAASLDNNRLPPIRGNSSRRVELKTSRQLPTLLVRDSDVPMAKPSPSRPRTAYVAISDYTARVKTEISFKYGDIIDVVDKDATGWMQGRIRGGGGLSDGWFPSTFVTSFRPDAAYEDVPALNSPERILSTRETTSFFQSHGAVKLVADRAITFQQASQAAPQMDDTMVGSVSGSTTPAAAAGRSAPAAEPPAGASQSLSSVSDTYAMPASPAPRLSRSFESDAKLGVDHGASLHSDTKVSYDGVDPPNVPPPASPQVPSKEPASASSKSLPPPSTLNRIKSFFQSLGRSGRVYAVAD